MAMTALALLARWSLDAATTPTHPADADAVGRLRLGQLARLPLDEQRELFRLLNEGLERSIDSPLGDVTPQPATLSRQKGPPSWQH